jgi:hypothetical protein
MARKRGYKRSRNFSFPGAIPGVRVATQVKEMSKTLGTQLIGLTAGTIVNELAVYPLVNKAIGMVTTVDNQIAKTVIKVASHIVSAGLVGWGLPKIVLKNRADEIMEGAMVGPVLSIFLPDNPAAQLADWTMKKAGLKGWDEDMSMMTMGLGQDDGMYGLGDEATVPQARNAFMYGMGDSAMVPQAQNAIQTSMGDFTSIPNISRAGNILSDDMDGFIGESDMMDGMAESAASAQMF